MMGGSVLWVTGAGGFIGGEVVRQAEHRGYRVVGIGHGDHRCFSGQSAFVSGALTAETLDQAQAISGAPHAVVHLAGGSSVAESLKNPEADRLKTVDSSRLLCAWLDAHAPEACMVAASSAAVYGASSEPRLREETRCNPQSPYGQHKLQMEELLCKSALGGRSITIVRLFSVIGAGLRKQLFFDMARRAAQGENPLVLSGSGEERRDYISRSDCARLLLDAIGWAQSPAMIVNGGTGNPTSIREAAAEFARAWSARTGHPLLVDFNGKTRPGDPSALVAQVSRMNALGFTPSTSLRTELEHYVAWFQDEAGA